MEYNDNEFSIEPNINCPEKIGFLHYKEKDLCVGGYELSSEGYEVSINCYPDEETGSDSSIIATVASLDEAKNILWENRYNAI